MSFDKQNQQVIITERHEPTSNVYLCRIPSVNVLTKQSIHRQLNLVLIDTSSTTEIRQQK